MIVDDILFDPALPTNARVILAFLVACLGVVELSKNRLAPLLGMDIKTANRAFAALAARGIVITTKNWTIQLDWDRTEENWCKQSCEAVVLPTE